MPSELEIGRRYLWKRSEGWVINNVPNRWLVYVTPIGWNGAGGYWLNEEWCWHNCGNTHHVQPRSLSYEDSRSLEREIAALDSATIDPAVATPVETAIAVDAHKSFSSVLRGEEGS